MNIDKIRGDFPFFQKNKNLVYLDSACMTLKPRQVIEAVNNYYTDYSSCAGRSSHRLSSSVGERVEGVRKTVRNFINARGSSEIIFTRNSTEGLNLLSNSLDYSSVLISSREHNSNLLPWLARDKKVLIIRENSDHILDMDDFSRRIKDTDIVSIVYKSNLDGYSLPVRDIIKTSHENKKLVILDGAQAVPHTPVDVKKLNADFLVFSGHKMLGPTGTGVLYGKSELISRLNPFMVGGGTAIDSTYTSFKLEDAPKKFEAGLQDYAGIFGLGAALEYLKKIGMENIEDYCLKLGRDMFDGLSKLGVDFVGVKDYLKCGGIANFNIGKSDSHDVALMLDSAYKIAVRSGAHCVHSWFNANKLKGSVRASLYIYNNKEDVEKFLNGVAKVKKVLAK